MQSFIFKSSDGGLDHCLNAHQNCSTAVFALAERCLRVSFLYYFVELYCWDCPNLTSFNIKITYFYSSVRYQLIVIWGHLLEFIKKHIFYPIEILVISVVAMSDDGGRWINHCFLTWINIRVTESQLFLN